MAFASRARHPLAAKIFLSSASDALNRLRDIDTHDARVTRRAWLGRITTRLGLNEPRRQRRGDARTAPLDDSHRAPAGDPFGEPFVIQVAANWSNSVPAPAASYLIMGAELGGTATVVGLTPANELTVPLAASGICGPAIPFSGSSEPADAPLPPDADVQVAHQLEDEQLVKSEPELQRNLVRCVRSAVDPAGARRAICAP
jgi:hypothetical protein